MFCRRHC